MDELKQLRSKILQCCALGGEVPAAFDDLINLAVLAKSTADLEEINTSIRM